MKNKEIKEILNYMKQYVENKYEHDSEPMLNYKDLQIVLSYIEQLENNRDKAIDYIEKHFEKEYKKPKEELKHYNLKNCTYDSGLVVLGILKGDSDE